MYQLKIRILELVRLNHCKKSNVQLDPDVIYNDMFNRKYRNCYINEVAGYNGDPDGFSQLYIDNKFSGNYRFSKSHVIKTLILKLVKQGQCKKL